MFSGGRLVDGHGDAEPVDEEGEWEQHRGITGWISGGRPRGVISLCDSFIVNEEKLIYTFMKWLSMELKHYNQLLMTSK